MSIARWNYQQWWRRKLFGKAWPLAPTAEELEHAAEIFYYRTANAHRRHPEPFGKRRAGKLRRAQRRFKHQWQTGELAL